MIYGHKPVRALLSLLRVIGAGRSPTTSQPAWGYSRSPPISSKQYSGGLDCPLSSRTSSETSRIIAFPSSAPPIRWRATKSVPDPARPLMQREIVSPRECDSLQRASEGFGHRSRHDRHSVGDNRKAGPQRETPGRWN
jgi:hypothetical protein